MSDQLSYPRVTEVLHPYTSYNEVPQNILQHAAARGTRVHAICAGIANGAWITNEAMGEECVGYVRSFEQWFDQYVEEVLLVEKRYIDKVLGYTGQIDFLIRAKNGTRCLVDLKTSARPQKTYGIQMAAYSNLLDSEGIMVDRSMLVYLNKIGDEAKVVEASTWHKELHVFKCALTCYKYFHKGNYGREDIEFTSKDSSSHG